MNLQIRKLEPNSIPTRAFMLVKIESDQPKLKLDQVEVNIIISQSLKSLFGEIGMIGLVPNILKYDPDSRLIILETSDNSIEGLTQALCLTTGISSTNPYKFVFKILNVTKFLSNIDVNSRNDFF